MSLNSMSRLYLVDIMQFELQILPDPVRGVSGTVLNTLGHL
ncbi:MULTISPECIES: hypothetical protein [Roseobacteraceae]|nr:MULTISPECIES: hypothetical protein [Roseobacteraceae]